MPRLPSEPDKPPTTKARVYGLIGRITSDWAALEFYINEVIWELAETPPAYGACMTAQIFSLDGRLRALLALLKLRRADKTLIKAVNKFSESARKPVERRNRVVHDPWGFRQISESESQASQIEVTANRNLVFRLRDIDIDELDKDQQIIHDCVLKFIEIRDKIFAEISSLPEIPQSELRPIRRDPRQPR